jgi:hypothetical protein
MRTRLALACLALSAAPSAAGEPVASYWQPSLYLLGTSEHGRGDAYAPPNDSLKRDDAASLAFGLDARQGLPGGRIEASGFALLHDPFASERGFSFTGRVRGTFGPAGGGWRVRFEESPRFQRRETATLSDFQRNDVWIGVERDTAAGTVLGLRVGDRRRSVDGDPLQGFNRQSLLASIGGGLRRQWRFEAGPQRFATETFDGWRLVTTAELLGQVLRTQTAVRLTWIEPFADDSGAASLRAAFDVPPPAVPVPTSGPSTEGPGASPGMPPTTAIDARSQEGLLGPALVVDPLEGDEGDWDFGRRKLELVAVAARRLGPLQLTAELRVQRERGESAFAPEVRRDRMTARVHVRRELGSRVALLAQGGWQRLKDNRGGFSFDHGIVSVGLQLRP